MLLPPPPTATGSVSHEERDLMAGVLSLGTETVADVMTPRLDIEAIDSRAGWREVVERLRQSEHARLPVYQDDLDDIVGILYAKDVAPIVTGIAHAHDNWRELLRPAQFVPESKPLASQLYDFQRSAGHLAIVVDEFGGTSGLVTLEDVLEEVVGEIHGEYDADEEPPVVQEGEDRYWVDGAVTLDTLAESLGIPIERDDISTVGGLIYSELGHVPKPGEELTVGDFRVVVEKVVQRRIHRVYFERRRAPAEVEPEAGDRV
jgi:CBS domain containing-hemolysin-like protein